MFPLQFRASLPGIVAGIVTKPEFRGLPKKWIDWRSGPLPEVHQPEVAEGHRLDLLPKGDLLSGEVLDRVNNLFFFIHSYLKFKYSEKAKTFEKKYTNLFWSYIVSFKKLGFFFQIFWTFSEYMNFITILLLKSSNQLKIKFSWIFWPIRNCIIAKNNSSGSKNTWKFKFQNWLLDLVNKTMYVPISLFSW